MCMITCPSIYSHLINGSAVWTGQKAEQGAYIFTPDTTSNKHIIINGKLWFTLPIKWPTPISSAYKLGNYLWILLNQ